MFSGNNDRNKSKHCKTNIYLVLLHCVSPMEAGHGVRCVARLSALARVRHT